MVHFNISQEKKHIIQKIITYFIILPTQLLNIVCFVYLIKNPHLILRYLPSPSPVQAGLTCYYIPTKYYTIDENNPLIKNYTLPITTASQKLQDYILKRRKQLKDFRIYGYILTAMGTAAFLPFLKDEDSILLVKRILDEYLNPTWAHICTVHCFISINILGFFTIRLISNIVSTNNFVQEQYLILDEMISNIHYEPNQVLLHKKLIECIKHHINLLSLSKLLFYGSQKFSLILIVLLFQTLIIQTTSVYFIMAGISPSSDFRYVLVLLFTGYMTVALIHSGQQFKNCQENIYYSLCQTHWYDWNNDNMKLLLMMLRQCSKPIRFSVCDYMDLDYPEFLKILRTVYGVVTLLTKFK